MPSTRDIRRRIKSVKNTSQITKAMQMVAASKMRKAQQAALSGRPYAELISEMIVSVRTRVNLATHPLLEQREVEKELLLVISTDKGLCGGLNTNLLREATRYDKDKTAHVTAGRKALQFMSRTKRDVAADFQLGDTPTFLEVKAAAKFCVDKFLSGEVDKVTVLYTRFVNTLTQTPIARTLLPITAAELDQVGGTKESANPEDENDFSEYLFEPSASDVLSAILPHYLYYQVYQMVLNARASEHSARMVAMKGATDNAKQIIKDLTLEYNKIRQASITTELLEITTAQMALGN